METFRPTLAPEGQEIVASCDRIGDLPHWQLMHLGIRRRFSREEKIEIAALVGLHDVIGK